MVKPGPKAAATMLFRLSPIFLNFSRTVGLRSYPSFCIWPGKLGGGRPKAGAVFERLQGSRNLQGAAFSQILLPSECRLPCSYAKKVAIGRKSSP